MLSGGRYLAALSLLGLPWLATGQNMDVDWTSQSSIHDAASTVAYNMMSYYIGNQTGQSPGMFPGSGTPTGYYWWEGSEAFEALLNFWYYFGDASYNQVVSEALVSVVECEARTHSANFYL